MRLVAVYARSPVHIHTRVDLPSHRSLLLPRPFRASRRLTTGLLLGAALGGFTPACAAEVWVPIAPMNTARANHRSIRLDDGRILVVGGGSTSCEVYDPVAGTWSMTGSTSHEFNARFPPIPLLRLDGGRIMAITAVGAPTDCEIYDPAVGTWSTAASLPGEHDQANAAVLPDGRVLIAGGMDMSTSSTMASTLIYDPTINAWTASGDEVTARRWASLTRLDDGRLMLIGGD